MEVHELLRPSNDVHKIFRLENRARENIMPRDTAQSDDLRECMGGSGILAEKLRKNGEQEVPLRKEVQQHDAASKMCACEERARIKQAHYKAIGRSRLRVNSAKFSPTAEQMANESAHKPTQRCHKNGLGACQFRQVCQKGDIYLRLLQHYIEKCNMGVRFENIYSLTTTA
ncbi:hypothetical protein Tcan_11411 [Toxocara canis]|uniref:Uncharacterized protein n=1 Tax=Toxocara canis TaxID=6265 RepID=A0A0B2VUT0_TOXCA|nr:hypothetical protein Tcan_11411 [Toxocara canis]